MTFKLIQANTIALLIVLAALPASNALAEEGMSKIPVNLEVVQTQFRTSQDINGDGEVAYRLTSHYKGAPGRAESTGFSEVAAIPSDPSVCPADFLAPFVLPIVLFEDALIFQDLSTLYISGTGLLCFDFATFTGVITADFDVAGGSGQYHAVGQLVVGSEPQVVVLVAAAFARPHVAGDSPRFEQVSAPGIGGEVTAVALDIQTDAGSPDLTVVIDWLLDIPEVQVLGHIQVEKQDAAQYQSRTERGVGHRYRNDHQVVPLEFARNIFLAQVGHGAL